MTALTKTILSTFLAFRIAGQDVCPVAQHLRSIPRRGKLRVSNQFVLSREIKAGRSYIICTKL